MSDENSLYRRKKEAEKDYAYLAYRLPHYNERDTQAKVGYEAKESETKNLAEIPKASAGQVYDNAHQPDKETGDAEILISITRYRIRIVKEEKW